METDVQINIMIYLHHHSLKMIKPAAHRFYRQRQNIKIIVFSTTSRYNRDIKQQKYRHRPFQAIIVINGSFTKKRIMDRKKRDKNDVWNDIDVKAVRFVYKKCTTCSFSLSIPTGYVAHLCQI